MTKLEIIGGQQLAGKFANTNDNKERALGPSGEHGKDHFLKMTSILNPVGAHKPLSQPTVYGEYLFRIMHTTTSGSSYAHIQVIQRNTLNVIRMIKVTTDAGSGEYSSIVIENGKFVFMVKHSSNGGHSFIVSGSVDTLLQEALKSDSPYVTDASSLFTSVLVSDVPTNTDQYGSNSLVYDGANHVYYAAQTTVSKIAVSTGVVVWKKTLLELTTFTNGYFTGIQLLADRVVLTANINSPQETHMIGLKLTDGSSLISRVIKNTGGYGPTYRDIGIIGLVGTDIIVKGALFIARFNSITLSTVWFKRFPYNLISLPARLNLAYNEIPLTFFESAPSDYASLQSVKLDLATGLEKKILYNIAVNDINFIYYLDGDYILGGDSGIYSISEYVETERVV